MVNLNLYYLWYCLKEEPDQSFSITGTKNANISTLKKFIKSGHIKTYKSVEAQLLTLWKNFIAGGAYNQK